MHSPSDNQAIIRRCAALALSLDQVQRLAGENHSLWKIAQILGLDPLTLTPLKQRNWLRMAALTCSVSYREPLTPEGLLEVLATGILPRSAASTFLHFLEEAPLVVVVMSVEQAAKLSGVGITQIWCNLDNISTAWSSPRLRSMGT
jgi:hypothetical protein